MTPGLSSQEHHFSLPPGVHYLNCAYMGPLPRNAEEAGIRGLRAKRHPQSILREEFFRPSDELRARFARLIGASRPESVAIVPAVSYAAATIARNTRVGPGANIVITHEQFPANVYPWRRLILEQGGELRVVAPPPPGPGGYPRRGEGWTGRILEGIDRNTRLVAMGTVHWTDGTRFDLGAVRERTRDMGAALVLDGTQSVGAMPIDVASLRPDALMVAGYKWLLGPYSLSLAYYGERYMDGVPLEETWIARRGAEDFSSLVEYEDAYQAGAIRFDVGERSNFALIPALSGALDLVLKWSPERIADYCRALTKDAWVGFRALGLGVEEEAWRAPHLFGLRLPPGGDMADVARNLRNRRVDVSFRGSSVRVSPHVYNTVDDMDALIEALARGLGA